MATRLTADPLRARRAKLRVDASETQYATAAAGNLRRDERAQPRGKRVLQLAILLAAASLVAAFATAALTAGIWLRLAAR
jgi:hypothetical protein